MSDELKIRKMDRVMNDAYKASIKEGLVELSDFLFEAKSRMGLLVEDDILKLIREHRQKNQPAIFNRFSHHYRRGWTLVDAELHDLYLEYLTTSKEPFDESSMGAIQAYGLIQGDMPDKALEETYWDMDFLRFLIRTIPGYSLKKDHLGHYHGRYAGTWSHPDVRSHMYVNGLLLNSEWRQGVSNGDELTLKCDRTLFVINFTFLKPEKSKFRIAYLNGETPESRGCEQFKKV